MENNKKKERHYFRGFIIFLFIIYMIVFIMEKTGYYEYNSYKKSSLTKEQMESFEKDLKNGKKVNLKNYKPKEIDYGNGLSDLGFNLSLGTSEIINKGVTTFFDTVVKLSKD